MISDDYKSFVQTRYLWLSLHTCRGEDGRAPSTEQYLLRIVRSEEVWGEEKSSFVVVVVNPIQQIVRGNGRGSFN